MFDFHVHSSASYDASFHPQLMADAAAKAGLSEICFTDHLDYMRSKPRQETGYDVAFYNELHSGVSAHGVTIRHGVEVGLTPWNKAEIREDLGKRHYDFVLGSVHFVADEDPYFAPYWQGKTVEEAELAFFRENLRCVELHEDFDVLGHLTYIGKTAAHPARRKVELAPYRDLTAAIFEALIAKGKGIEVNSSGVDVIGDFLPGEEFLRLYRDLGGEIVTVGSDAHTPERVGQYADRALTMLIEIFGHVCTFANREPVFHKL